MNRVMSDEDIQKPEFRYDLKAAIIKAGYKTLTDFSKKAKVDLPTVSRIVSGRQIPGPLVQKNLAQCLGITLRELRGLIS